MIQRSFKVTVSGIPWKTSSIIVLRALIHGNVLKVDPKVIYNEYNFQGNNYRFEWVGVPFNIDKLQFVQSVIDSKIRSELANWEYSIRLNILETG